MTMLKIQRKFMFNARKQQDCLVSHFAPFHRKYTTAALMVYVGQRISYEGREGVNWELGFAFFRGWEMRFCALGLGLMKKE